MYETDEILLEKIANQKKMREQEETVKISKQKRNIEGDTKPGYIK